MRQQISVRQIGKNSWQTDQTCFFLFKGHTIKIERGFEFDLATVPRIVWPIIGKHELLTMPPLIHDYLYANKGLIRSFSGEVVDYTRKEADDLFEEELEAEGFKWIKRSIAYRFVRTFGWIYWYR